MEKFVEVPRDCPNKNMRDDKKGGRWGDRSMEAFWDYYFRRQETFRRRFLVIKGGLRVFFFDNIIIIYFFHLFVFRNYCRSVLYLSTISGGRAPSLPPRLPLPFRGRYVLVHAVGLRQHG